jgi:ketopantoate reductase
VRLYGAGGKTTCLHRSDVGYDRWCKLVYNASFNPVCALTGLDTSELQAAASIMNELVIPAMNEVINVAQAIGYRLPESIVDDTIRSNPIEDRVAPSMLVDLRKVGALPGIEPHWASLIVPQGNLIEHENILGEVVRVAAAASVRAPILATLYSLCCGVQERLRNDR